MTKYIAIDLDGCVSDDTWRLPLIDHSIADLDQRYHAYNIRCGEDKPITENINLLANILELTGAVPVVITARPSYVRQYTIDWMQENFPFAVAPGCIYLRPQGDGRHSPELKLNLLECFMEEHSCNMPQILCVFDDREDVCEFLRSRGLRATLLRKPGASFNETHVNDVDCILHNMANTYRERNAVYGSNYKMIAPMADILFPDGVPANVLFSDQWHLFELILVKLSRFAISDLQHTDSIHDAAVYCAMIESIIKKSKEIPR